MKKKKKSIDYGKWGYIFILPFFVTYIIFSLIPLIDTVRYSFFEYYRSGIKEVGPNFIGMENYVSLLHSDMLKYGANTLILWMIGFIPQIVIALVLAAWFTDVRLKIRGQQFFKVVIYLPNLIMASAFALLFFTMFSTNGPINSILMSIGILKKPIDFLGSVFGTRSLIGFMNFLMWFGNTTIMLMAAIMGISQDVFEASDLDGCNSIQRFFYITLPLIRPILAYTLITSIIGGLQMFDVPQILTNTIKACGNIRFLLRRILRFSHKKYCQKAILFLTVFLSFFNLSIILIQFQSYVSLSLKASESLSLKVLYTFQLLFLMLFHRKLLFGSSTD